jgi:hypothetical protein
LTIGRRSEKYNKSFMLSVSELWNTLDRNLRIKTILNILTVSLKEMFKTLEVPKHFLLGTIYLLILRAR